MFASVVSVLNMNVFLAVINMWINSELHLFKKLNINNEFLFQV
jgi:hypothetical protein